MKAGEEAEEKGFDQVLWLDANEKKYVEEVGSMNMFFVIGGEVITPALVGFHSARHHPQELYPDPQGQEYPRHRAPHFHR